MSRPLRIEYPDAYYHVTNKGRRGESVFRKKDDYLAFIELLRETADMWNLRVGAYCLMPGHYHLLLQTPDANLSRCMRHVNGVSARGRFGGDWQGTQYDAIQFGQQCRRKNEGENIRGSTIEKTRRGN